ncbi:phosphoribosylanthranilate isomerase [Flavobacterium sp. RSB2_4_14]|uniref:phosphoribosylanthranilate isomerase n=1 Tax=Flavobacterium sp. RSB2_4_14 TaxID=3447665 RepID=UPI003F36F296
MKIKICGMKFPENIGEVAALQPDYLGFIFYGKSPRNFENSIPILDTSIQKVGVFVNATYEKIEEKVKQYNLDLVQLHGEETPELCAEIETNLVKVIKAFSVDNQFNYNNLSNYNNSCSYFLFDTKGNNYGGNGVTFDWSILAKYHLEKPYFLSGGISLENTTALKEFLIKDYAKNCFAIDLNSKFEIEPGMKNAATLTKFIQNLK